MLSRKLGSKRIRPVFWLGVVMAFLFMDPQGVRDVYKKGKQRAVRDALRGKG